MQKSIKISDFYKTYYKQAALYQTFRTVANVVDGLKNGARKVLYVVDSDNITTDIKVANLSARVIERTEYLHAAGSLEGAIVTLAQNFVGTNNCNLLMPEGSFGTRFVQEASASRYIHTKKSPWFDKLFDKKDYPILNKQEFEGKQIEPQYYVPILPLILINGSEGIGNGFSQKIFPRKLEDIKQAVLNIIEGKKVKELIPYINGYKGIIEKTGDKSYVIKGCIERENATTMLITEIPFQYDLSGYLSILDKLVDNKIIKDYEDFSDNHEFKFRLDVTREFSKLSDEEILTKLKLIKNVTENFTCIDENNQVHEFKSEIEILEYWVKIRLDYYNKRKTYLLKDLDNDLIRFTAKFKFIKLVVEEKLVVFKKPIQEIEKQLIEFKLSKIDDSYDFYYIIPIVQSTKEKLEELNSKIAKVTEEKNDLLNKSIETLWKNDMEKL